MHVGAARIRYGGRKSTGFTQTNVFINKKKLQIKGKTREFSRRAAETVSIEIKLPFSFTF